MNQPRSKTAVLIFLTLWISIAFCDRAEAYIGPGAGFAFLGTFLVFFIALALALVTILMWPIRAVIRLIYKKRALTDSLVDRIVIVGLDGLDPARARKYIKEGKLPNLKKMMDKGCFHPLATTIPSMSPVAWSSFQTGVDPSKHNIFDFLARDPKSYMSVLSSADIKDSGNVIKIGKFRIPLGKPRIKLLRKGIPFWKILGDRKIFSSIIRVPITFPPEKFYGVSLSAMCVPDLRGTQGTFSFYTTEKIDGDTTQGVRIPVEWKGDTIEAAITGPPNSLKEGAPEMKAPMKVEVDKAARTARFTIGDDTFTLKEREYSDWIRIQFKAGLGIKVQGLCRIYVMEMAPEFKCYVTPVHIDPDNPALPISHPFTYATYLAKKFGPYATLGLAEDTWALNERIIDESAFLKQAYLIHDERERMLFDALEKTKNGVVVTVFDATDRIQHMFMRYTDPTHPANRDKDTEEHKNAIEDLYVRMDGLIGRVQEKCDSDRTVLMVVSDHGFKTFRRGINLNSWLLKEGYMHLKDGAEKSGEWFDAVDWSRTKAFALGLTGIYLNVKGREAKGIVEPGADEAAVKEAITAGLMELYDDEEKKQVFSTIYDAAKVFNGPYVSNCPDLLIGYDIGYRASWDCAVGKVDDTIIEDNVKSWSGDHCIDPVKVPGVFFCNCPIDTDKPRLMDIAPTILHLFGVEKQSHMDGVNLIEGSPAFGSQAATRDGKVA
jgi:predicted AlkP superfamily phosphohydrolase/phosphomutase